MKRIYLDTETTGLQPYINGLWQIAGLIEIDGREAEEFCIEFAPLPADHIDPAALAVNRRTEQELRNLQPAQVGYSQFCATLASYIDKFDKFDKFYLVGYNVAFDAEFLRAWFNKLHDRYFGSWFWHPYLCAMGLAGQHFAGRRHELADFKQGTVAAALGIEVDPGQQHGALYDVRLTKQIYERVTNGEPPSRT